MEFFNKLLGRESLEERVNRLWENAEKLRWSIKKEDKQKAASVYTELLDLIDESSTSFNVCAMLRNRAVCYSLLRDFDSALADLEKELKIAQRQGDQQRIRDCQGFMGELREEKQSHEMVTAEGEIADKFQAMKQLSIELMGAETDSDAAFNSLFEDLQNDNPDIRNEAARLLAMDIKARNRLISIFQQFSETDPHRSSLAGRVLGRIVTDQSKDTIMPQITQMWFGFSASFISSTCVYCGHMNRGIAAPPRGPMIPYFHREKNEGAYTIPVLCDKCGKEFFVAWDVDPRQT
jgi:tetratricopeptide (TPR) repeat protein